MFRRKFWKFLSINYVGWTCVIPWITITLGKAGAANAVLHHVEQLVLLPHSLHDLGQIIADSHLSHPVGFDMKTLITSP